MMTRRIARRVATTTTHLFGRRIGVGCAFRDGTDPALRGLAVRCHGGGW